MVSVASLLKFKICVTGNEYYVASISYERTWPQQALIVGVENRTNVRIELTTDPLVEVEYGGKTYMSKDVLLITIDKYETFQFTTFYGMVCTRLNKTLSVNNRD